MTAPPRRAAGECIASASLSALFAGSGLAAQTTGEVHADSETARRCSAQFHDGRLISTTATTICDAAFGATSFEAMAQRLLGFRDAAVSEPVVFTQPSIDRIQ